MTQQHPINPPPSELVPEELLDQWEEEWHHGKVKHIELEPYIAARSAQWGANQELEACCEWLHWQNLATHSELIPSLRAARRPKAPSLKEQALELIDGCTDPESDYLDDNALSIIRRALEQLDD